MIYTLKLIVEIDAQSPEEALVEVYMRLRAGFKANTDPKALLIREGDVEVKKPRD